MQFMVFQKTDWIYLLILFTYLNFVDSEGAQKERKFICPLCKKSFVSKFALYNHNRTKHDESNPNKCEICLKVFAYKFELDAHSRVHTG